jgi:hypothetical protein
MHNTRTMRKGIITINGKCNVTVKPFLGVHSIPVDTTTQQRETLESLLVQQVLNVVLRYFVGLIIT